MTKTNKATATVSIDIYPGNGSHVTIETPGQMLQTEWVKTFWSASVKATRVARANGQTEIAVTYNGRNGARTLNAIVPASGEIEIPKF